nr:hypothetical protein [Nostoc sp. CreGUA01]
MGGVGGVGGVGGGEVRRWGGRGVKEASKRSKQTIIILPHPPIPPSPHLPISPSPHLPISHPLIPHTP